MWYDASTCCDIYNLNKNTRDLFGNLFPSCLCFRFSNTPLASAFVSFDIHQINSKKNINKPSLETCFLMNQIILKFESVWIQDKHRYIFLVGQAICNNLQFSTSSDQNGWWHYASTCSDIYNVNKKYSRLIWNYGQYEKYLKFASMKIKRT